MAASRFRKQPPSDSGASVVRASATLFVKTRVDGGSLADERRATLLAKGIGPDVVVVPRGRGPVLLEGGTAGPLEGGTARRLLEGGTAGPLLEGGTAGPLLEGGTAGPLEGGTAGPLLEGGTAGPLLEGGTAAFAAVLLTRRVPGKHRPRLAHDDDALALVGTALAHLHARKCPRSFRPLPGGATLAATLAELATSAAAVRDVIGADASRRARAVARQVRSAVDDAFIDESETPRALCHGDVRAANLLFAGRAVRLLDFGLAGRGDPAVDLARFFAYERLDEHARFVAAHTYAEAAHRHGDATVDRALLLFPAMPLALALSSLRYARAAVAGVFPVANAAAQRARIPELRRRIARLLDDAEAPRHHVERRRKRSRAPAASAEGDARTRPGIPRVPHLFGSRPGRDDLVVGEERVFRTRRVVVMEKLDGVAVALSLNDAGDVDVLLKREWRAAQGGAILRAVQRWARVHEARLRALLLGPARFLLGEWLGHKLVVGYDALPAFLVVHSIVEGERLVPRLRSNALARRAGLAAMDPVFTGVVGPTRAWASLLPARARFAKRRAARPEGIVVEASNTWAKWVAPHYRQPQPSEISGAWNRVSR